MAKIKFVGSKLKGRVFRPRKSLDQLGARERWARIQGALYAAAPRCDPVPVTPVKAGKSLGAMDPQPPGGSKTS